MSRPTFVSVWVRHSSRTCSVLCSRRCCNNIVSNGQSRFVSEEAFPQPADPRDPAEANESFERAVDIDKSILIFTRLAPVDQLTLSEGQSAEFSLFLCSQLILCHIEDLSFDSSLRTRDTQPGSLSSFDRPRRAVRLQTTVMTCPFRSFRFLCSFDF